MKKNNIFIAILLCILTIVLIFAIKEIKNKNDVEKENDTKTETSNIISNNKKDENKKKEDKKQETKDEISDEVQGETDSSEGDENALAVVEGISIFDVPFGDGYEFPDLSDTDFIFIGDSIFDMNNSETSMPRQLEVYTNSRVYNISKNGSCAGNDSSGYIGLHGLTECFVTGTTTGNEDNKSANRDIEKYGSDSHKKRKTVIVINQCINDYIFATKISNPNDAYDINTYEGSLRTNISRLKSAYPKADIVYMEPYVIGVMDYGKEKNSYGYTMNDYVAALERVGAENKIRFFNLRSYDFFADYRDGYLLEDGLHPNDMAAKTMARLFCDFVVNNLR